MAAPRRPAFIPVSWRVRICRQEIKRRAPDSTRNLSEKVYTEVTSTCGLLVAHGVPPPSGVFQPLSHVHVPSAPQLPASAQSRSLVQTAVAAAELSSSSDFSSPKLNSSNQLCEAQAICQTRPIEADATVRRLRYTCTHLTLRSLVLRTSVRRSCPRSCQSAYKHT